MHGTRRFHPIGSGAHLVEILKKCKSGQIKALYVLGENPLATFPASMEVRAALERLELLVVQDPFLTETAKMAHFVLPACTYAEKDGHLYEPRRSCSSDSSGDGSLGRKLAGLAHHDRPRQCHGLPMGIPISQRYSERNHEASSRVLQSWSTSKIRTRCSISICPTAMWQRLRLVIVRPKPL